MKSMIYGLISALLAWFDLYVKKFVEDNVDHKEEELVCKDRIVIRKVYNEGFALNKAEDHPKLVKTVSVGALSSIAVYSLLIWKRSVCTCEKLAAALVLAGGFSNTYERLKKGRVVDYFSFKTKWKKFNRLTFNLGDFYIFLGGFILMIRTIMKKSCR